ncbi:phytoene/squalene synthase family protein [bacterium]|nr:phytoene/squalene synthase family protein [bacterium]
MTSFNTNTYSIKSEGKSFYWASFFLPKKNRIAASRLYSICRYLDDVADNSKLDTSSQIKNIFNQIKENESSEINIFFKKNNINLSILKDLINGLISDQQKVRVTDEKELIDYSYKVAGTVGLMMLPIINTKDAEARKHAIDLGIAMQLTNIARDVYEDAKMNRLYLPKEWLGQVSISDLIDNKLDDQKKKLIELSIKNLLELSDKFYANGFSGMKFIPFRTRLAIFFAAKIYKGIGEKIKSGGYVYKLERIYLNKLEKLWITIISIPEFLFLKNIFKSYKPIRGSFKNENI